MNQDQFFETLAASLDRHPYKERYLEELRDHVDDLKVDNKLETLTSEQIDEHMGDPEGIKGHFLKIMHPFRGVQFVLEGLFFGLLSIPNCPLCLQSDQFNLQHHSILG